MGDGFSKPSSGRTCKSGLESPNSEKTFQSIIA